MKRICESLLMSKKMYWEFLYLFQASSAALFSKYYLGEGEFSKQTHLSLGVQAKVFLLQTSCCDYVISGISLLLLIRLNSTITENPPGERPLAWCCRTKWGGGGIPCGGQQGGSSCEIPSPAQSWKFTIRGRTHLGLYEASSGKCKIKI